MLFLIIKKIQSLKYLIIMKKKELGTMGPLSIMNKLPENFFVMNGDIITNLNIDQFFKEHVKSKKMISVAVTERKECYKLWSVKNR